MSFRNWSISKKILLGMLPLFLLFVVLSVALNNRYQEQEMMEQAQLAAHTYADIIKEALVNMMVTNYEVDESFLERVSLLQQFDTMHILINNNLKLREEILAEKRLKPLASRHKTTMAHDEPEREVLRSGLPKFTRNGDHFRGIVPFNATEVCQKCHAVPRGYTLGAADIHISLSRIALAAQENWRRSFIIFLGFSIVVVAFASMLFSRFVSRPVDKLVKATTEISAGNLDHDVLREVQPLQEHSRDELALLFVRFDAMRESLKEKIEQLDEVNKSLAERNAEVEQTLMRLKQAQEELVRSERLAATGKMTAQLSHEINNPIHNIQSLLESSLKKIEGQPKELVALALEEVTRMARLTRQMLEFYRGTLVDIEKNPVDIQELIEQLLKENEGTLLDNKIHTVFEMSSAPVVLGSRDKLKQVLLNLIWNARDSMPHGGELHLKARQTNRTVRIEVSDTGGGIPPEHLGKIFDAFFTTKKEVSGVGLGLSVSYGIVQQHKGTISVASQIGAGTTFTIEIPASHS